MTEPRQGNGGIYVGVVVKLCCKIRSVCVAAEGIVVAESDAPSTFSDVFGDGVLADVLFDLVPDATMPLLLILHALG